jgi:hypothetical protein
MAGTDRAAAPRRPAAMARVSTVQTSSCHENDLFRTGGGRQREAGYFTWASGQAGGRRTRRPLLAQRPYRGASPDRRNGMSWTRKLAIAEYFARYRQPPDCNDGRVWVSVFAPSLLLAYFKDEWEYLVDATGADVRPWAPENHGRLIRLRRGT